MALLIWMMMTTMPQLLPATPSRAPASPLFVPPPDGNGREGETERGVPGEEKEAVRATAERKNG